jgi:hypothetical protein
MTAGTDKNAAMECIDTQRVVLLPEHPITP